MTLLRNKLINSQNITLVLNSSGNFRKLKNVLEMYQKQIPPQQMLQKKSLKGVV